MIQFAIKDLSFKISNKICLTLITCGKWGMGANHNWIIIYDEVPTLERGKQPLQRDCYKIIKFQ